MHAIEALHRNDLEGILREGIPYWTDPLIESPEMTLQRLAEHGIWEDLPEDLRPSGVIQGFGNDPLERFRASLSWERRFREYLAAQGIQLVDSIEDADDGVIDRASQCTEMHHPGEADLRLLLRAGICFEGNAVPPGKMHLRRNVLSSVREAYLACRAALKSERERLAEGAGDAGAIMAHREDTERFGRLARNIGDPDADISDAIRVFADDLASRSATTPAPRRAPAVANPLPAPVPPGDERINQILRILQEDLAAARSSLEAVTNDRDRDRIELAGVKTSREYLEREVAALRAANDTLRSTTGDITKMTDTTMQEIRRLQQEIDAARVREARLEGELERAAREIAVLTARLAETGTALRGATTRSDGLARDLDAALDATAAVRDDLAVAVHERDAAREEGDRTAGRLADHALQSFSDARPSLARDLPGQCAIRSLEASRSAIPQDEGCAAAVRAWSEELERERAAARQRRLAEKRTFGAAEGLDLARDAFAGALLLTESVDGGRAVYQDRLACAQERYSAALSATLDEHIITALADTVSEPGSAEYLEEARHAYEDASVIEMQRLVASVSRLRLESGTLASSVERIAMFWRKLPLQVKIPASALLAAPALLFGPVGATVSGMTMLLLRGASSYAASATAVDWVRTRARAKRLEERPSNIAAIADELEALSRLAPAAAADISKATAEDVMAGGALRAHFSVRILTTVRSTDRDPLQSIRHRARAAHTSLLSEWKESAARERHAFLAKAGVAAGLGVVLHAIAGIVRASGITARVASWVRDRFFDAPVAPPAVAPPIVGHPDPAPRAPTETMGPPVPPSPDSVVSGKSSLTPKSVLPPRIAPVAPPPVRPTLDPGPPPVEASVVVAPADTTATEMSAPPIPAETPPPDLSVPPPAAGAAALGLLKGEEVLRASGDRASNSVEKLLSMAVLREAARQGIGIDAPTDAQKASVLNATANLGRKLDLAAHRLQVGETIRVSRRDLADVVRSSFGRSDLEGVKPFTEGVDWVRRVAAARAAVRSFAPAPSGPFAALGDRIAGLRVPALCTLPLPLARTMRTVVPSPELGPFLAWLGAGTNGASRILTSGALVLTSSGWAVDPRRVERLLAVYRRSGRLHLPRSSALARLSRRD